MTAFFFGPSATVLLGGDCFGRDIFKANETLRKQIFFYRLHNITDHDMSRSFRLEIAISRSLDGEVRLIGIRQEAKVRI